MERKQNGSSDHAPRRTGLAGDFERARTGTVATAAELREFMQNFRGKNPQEVLGLVTQAGLFQGIVLSTIGTFILFAAFTAGPYFLAQQAEANPKKGSKAKTAAKAAPAAETPVASNPAAGPAAPASPSGEASNADKALKKMGETETKTADPSKNPLDNLDNLLDDTK